MEYTVVQYNRHKQLIIKEYSRKEFIAVCSDLLYRPKKIFVGLGDFLEIGDYNQLLDAIFYDEESSIIENFLDEVNRKLSGKGQIPFSFLKLAVYYPDYLLKDVPTQCVFTVGAKTRLFPGACHFMNFMKHYNPSILTAIPYELAIEIIRRVGLDDNHLVATEYKKTTGQKNIELYAGDIEQFISGERKIIEIEKYMAQTNTKEEDVLYVGRGESSVITFSKINSIAFNPSDAIIPLSHITVYGSSLESLLVLFNDSKEINKFLLSDIGEHILPSLIVLSDVKEKPKEVIELEKKHRRLQANIIGQRIEHGTESYTTLKRDIELSLSAYPFNFQAIKDMVRSRLEKFKINPQGFVDEICAIAQKRYQSWGM